MKWKKNVISYFKTGTVEKCPVCGAGNVDITVHENGTRKSITFLCQNCKGSGHFDGFAEEQSMHESGR